MPLKAQWSTLNGLAVKFSQLVTGYRTRLVYFQVAARRPMRTSSQYIRRP